jgi:homoserine acetyltransferase
VVFGGLLKEHQRGLNSPDNVEAVQIPVEKIQGAILLMSAKRDQMWPSTEMSEQIVSRLAANNIAYHYEHIPFEAGHSGYFLKESFWDAVTRFLQEYYR